MLILMTLDKGIIQLSIFLIFSTKTYIVPQGNFIEYVKDMFLCRDTV